MRINGSNDMRKIIIMTLAITPSGALSPGPLSISAIVFGAFLGSVAGLVIGFGHMLFELPYVYMLHRFTSMIRDYIDRVRYYLNIGVIIFLAYFSYLLINDSMKIMMGFGTGASYISGSFSLIDALITGVLLTGLNAYFLLWWVTVGYPLIELSSRNGVSGFVALYSSHVWMDYAWLTLLSYGGSFIETTGRIPYSILLIVLAGILLYFASRTLIDIIRGLAKIIR